MATPVETDIENYRNIASALREFLGEERTFTPPQMAGAILEISTDANASTEDILESKTALVNRQKITGTMPRVEKANPEISVNGTNGTIRVSVEQSDGYVSGENKTATHILSKNDDPDFDPKNIRNGVNIFGVEGKMAALDEQERRGSSDADIDGANITFPPGYYPEEHGASVPTAQLASPSIVVSDTGLVTANVDQSAGYVSADRKTTTHQLSSADDADFVPENILAGRTIFGVAGNHLQNVDSLSYAIRFSSPTDFTIAYSYYEVSGRYLEWTDGQRDWSEWDGSALSSDGKPIYLRGKGNTVVGGTTSGRYSHSFIITGENVSCDGNIENLLDYLSVSNGLHPEMSAGCFGNLFYNCAALTSAPTLGALLLTSSCYSGMFQGCTSLTQPAKMRATILATYCCSNMYASCTSLTSLPLLPIKTLESSCYTGMFSRCSSIKLSEEKTEEYRYEYRIPTKENVTMSTVISRSQWGTNMFSETGGTFTGTPAHNTVYYLATPPVTEEGIPVVEKASPSIKVASSGKVTATVDQQSGYVYGPSMSSTHNLSEEDDANFKEENIRAGKTIFGKTGTYYDLESSLTNSLKFSSPEEFSVILTAQSGGRTATLEWTNGENNWAPWDGFSSISSKNGTLYVRGTGNSSFSNTTDSFRYFVLNGTDISCSGNIETLLDYKTVLNGVHPTMGNHCFSHLFRDCSSLISAPSLPATKLARYCYYNMFLRCTNLAVAPSLPAEEMSYCCYRGMFSGCASLASPPVLVSEKLDLYCYDSMFSGCKSLKTPISLPATELENYCYYNMFYGCESIKISRTASEEYAYEYRIPTDGTGISAANALTNMFYETGGSFKGTPIINTTYYLSSPPAGMDYEFVEKATPTISVNENGTITATVNQENGIVSGTNKTTTYKLSSNDDAQFVAENIKSNVEIFGVKGTLVSLDSATKKDAETFYISTEDRTIPSGTYLTGDQTIKGFVTTGIESGNIRQGVLAGIGDSAYAYRTYVWGSFTRHDTSTASNGAAGSAQIADGYSAWVDGVEVFGSIPAKTSLTVNGNKVTAEPGYYAGGAEATIAVGTLGTPAITVSSNKKTATVAAKVTKAGYFALNATTPNLSLSVQEGAEITPGTTSKSAIAAGKYATGDVTVKGDANLKSTNIVEGVTIFNVTGTRKTLDGVTARNSNDISVSATGVVTAASGYYASAATHTLSSSDDADFVGKNIKSGVTIFGVTGSHFDSPETLRNCLCFSSSGSFTLATSNGKKNWNGTLQWTNGEVNWQTWDGVNILSSRNGVLYIRGTKNTYITGTNGPSAKWVFTSAGKISCTGNIESILDYSDVANGKHPSMAAQCFHGLFNGCSQLTSAPELPSQTLTPSCYNDMFNSCSSLIYPPELPAPTLAEWCYSGMFAGCKSMARAPLLPASVLATGCYNMMFMECESLDTIPALPATTLAQQCYYFMFQNCKSLKISETKTGSYTNEYTIPFGGGGTDASNATNGTFNGTGGPFVGSPIVNKTYYVINLPVGADSTPVDKATPVISVSSGGLVTADVYQSNGYVSGPNKSTTYQLSTQGTVTGTPGTSDKTIVSAGKYTTGEINVKGDSNLVSGNIKKGVTIFGVSGSFDSIDSVTTRTSLSKTDNKVTAYSGYYPNDVSVTVGTAKTAANFHVDTKDRTIPAGTYLTGSQVIEGVAAYNLDSGNIRQGVRAYIGSYYGEPNSSGDRQFWAAMTLDGSFTRHDTSTASNGAAGSAQIADGYSAWVDGVEVFGSIPAKTSLTVNGNKVTAEPGYYAGGAEATIATATHPAPTVSINSNSGVVTATHVQGTGYVTGGTTTGTLSLETKAAEEYYPSLSVQYVSLDNKVKGIYLTGTQTINAVQITYTENRIIKYSQIPVGIIKSGVNLKIGDARDDDRIFNVTGTFTASNTVSPGQTAAGAAQIANGYSAWVDGVEVKGNIPSRTDVDVSGNVVTVQPGYYASEIEKTVGTAKEASTYDVSIGNRTIAVGTYISGVQTIRGVYTQNISAENIKYNVVAKVGDSANNGRLHDVTGTFTASNTVSGGQIAAGADKILLGYSAWVNGAEVKGELQTVTHPNPTVSVDSKGKITATHVQGTGYVTGGTTTGTLDMATKSSETYNVSTTDRTINSGVYLTGAQTIRGVYTHNISAENIKYPILVKVGDEANNERIKSVAGTFTASNTVSEGQIAAKSAQILSGYSAWVNGAEVKGELTTNTQSKTVTPTKSSQTVTPDTGYIGLSVVTVNKIPDKYQDVSQVTATASTVLDGYKFVNSSGTVVTGSMRNNDKVEESIDGINTTSYTILSGYHPAGGTVSFDSTTIENLLKEI